MREVPEELTADVSGMTVAALAWGPRDGPLLLALHGWLDNAMSFAPLAEHLDPRWRLIAMDLPGHGRSSHRGAGGAYHDLDFAADVLEAANTWAPSGAFALLGHSLGAKVATLVAGAAPARVSKLVLIEALGPTPAVAAASPPRLERFAKMRGKLGRKPWRVMPDRASAVARLVERGAGLSAASAQRLMERGLVEVADGVVFRADPLLQVPSPWALGEAEVEAFLERITCPTLLITAVQHHGDDLDLLAHRGARVPDLRHVELEGRHYLHMEDAPLVAALIDAHLR